MIGLITGNCDTEKIEFAVNPEAKIKIGDIVKFKVKDKFAFGIVTNILAKSYEPLEIALDYKSLSYLSEKLKGEGEIVVAEVKVLGYLENGKIKKLDFPPIPGEAVYLADEEEVRKIYCEEGKRYISLGKILDKDISPSLDLLNLTIKHLAIFGVTGSGKSHTVAVLVKRLVEKEIPVIIFDVHRDYIPTFKEPIIITFDPDDEDYLRRWNEEKGGNPDVRTVKFKLYEIEEYLPEILGISPEHHVNLYTLLRLMFEVEDLRPVTLNDFKEKLMKLRRQKIYEIIKGKTKLIDEDMLKDLEKRFGSAKASLFNRIKRLEEWKIICQDVEDLRYPSFEKIFGDEFTEGIVYPGKVTIIDLFPLSIEEQRIVIDIFLSKMFQEAKKLKKEGKNKITVCVIEEAHRFAAKDVRTAKMLGTIAREGRKFGLGLWLVSQIPSRISEDIISQINTFIFLRLTNPKDLNFIKASCPYLSEEYLESITKFDKGECLIVGLAVKQPVIVKIDEKVEIGGSELEFEKMFI